MTVPIDQDDLDETGCTMCDGEGWDDCLDPLQCGSEHKYSYCPCRACGGTGLRSMQRVF